MQLPPLGDVETVTDDEVRAHVGELPELCLPAVGGEGDVLATVMGEHHDDVWPDRSGVPGPPASPAVSTSSG